MRLVWEHDRAAAVAVAACIGHRDAAQIGAAATLRIEVGGATAGYAWYPWHDEHSMGLCVALYPRYRGRWTRQALGDLHKLPELLGARRLVGLTDGTTLTALLLRLGWTPDPEHPLAMSVALPWSTYNAVLLRAPPADLQPAEDHAAATARATAIA